MPSIDVAGCLANHWFVWSINGFGSILGLVTNMIVSFVFLKHFSNLAKSKPSVRKKPKTDFSKYHSSSPVPDTSTSPWDNDFTMTNTFGSSDV